MFDRVLKMPQTYEIKSEAAIKMCSIKLVALQCCCFAPSVVFKTLSNIYDGVSSENC